MMLEDLMSLQDAVRLLLASVLVVLVVALSRYRGLGLTSDLMVATVRAFAQLMVLAFFLTIVFELEDMLWIAAILVFMMVVASHTSAKRAKDITQGFRVSSISIVSSSTAIILGMVALGVIPMRGEYIIPLGGMVIGNSMNITSLAMERLRGEVRSNVLRIENLLALGATGDQAIRPMIRRSVQASLIPTVDNMRTLGLVWIPGLMSGMIIAGWDPAKAAVFQLVIIFMILASNTVASIVSTYLLSRNMFGRAEELVYR
ncbi:MAG: ABC transporter permease [Methanomassiliicoccales archaeon]